jgi:hypothetical protein
MADLPPTSKKLTFTTSLDDWMVFVEYTMKSSARHREAIFAWQWFFAIACGAIVAYIFADVSREVGLGAGALALAVVAASYPRFTRRRALAASRKEMSKKKLLPLYSSERTLEISDGGLRSDSVAGSQLLRWGFVEAVAETSTHAFILLPARSGFVIPKLGMDPEILQAFLSDLRARLQLPV